MCSSRFFRKYSQPEHGLRQPLVKIVRIVNSLLFALLARCHNLACRFIMFRRIKWMILS